MSNRKITKEMVATKNKKKVLSCSTPDRTLDSPSRDSDSEAASPVPFLCTQDGGEGVADVVWNYYGSASKNTRLRSSTPINKKSRKRHRLKLLEKEQQPTFPKRRVIKPPQKLEVPPELLEFHQYVGKLMEKKTQAVEKPQSGSEEDIFSEAPDCSPKSTFSSTRCLRKNVLSSKFVKPESENGLELDDSFNESLYKLTQAAENVFQKGPVQESNKPDPIINEDSMDAILKSIKSPYISKLKCASPGLKNDSFDSLVGNLDDSALERLTQMPVLSEPVNRKMDRSNTQNPMNDASPSSRFSFIRHSSMPESPTVTDLSRRTSAMPLGRYSSMPFNDSMGGVAGDSPTRCTPIEIQRKHQQAREKLLAKRLLPFTQTQQNTCNTSQATTQINDNKQAPKMFKFQPKVPTNQGTDTKKSETITNPAQSTQKQNTIKDMDLRLLIERKRQEALMKLRRKQQLQNK
ncbi:uncharacterized protein [Epargyreus clarus]|uniref:uncharacterized protein isoform X2 n=1 Tax=Epargyreus clarus TaxID=520877 RepID=UPI003C30256A